MSDKFFHTPVLMREVIDGLAIVPGGRYIDATVGGGGHGWEIVKLGGVLLGIDADPDALEFARQKFETESKTENWKLVQGNFRDIEKIAQKTGFTQVNGILFDLGVSSFQLDNPQKGFSYKDPETPIDLRLDSSQGQTGADLLNGLSESELEDIFIRFGEERLSKAIAGKIVKARSKNPINKAGDLILIIDKLVSDKKQIPGVLSRIFQALRIAVNDELSALKTALSACQKLLIPGGRLVVISFHSLEDRIVKQFMKSNAFEIITKKPITASYKEVMANRRARSAKLRIAQKI